MGVTLGLSHQGGKQRHRLSENRVYLGEYLDLKGSDSWL